MEILESEMEIYNSKMRLLNWLWDEIKLFNSELKEQINQKGQNLPINI
ncbi:MAG: hypothetical protein GF311_15020 [Candidatus Lokiarchaeota archaeon]|jgi:hypothetical protein|nr:hypothetical protein [Candidatus Lokiarchaeota archaeon]